MTGRACYCHLTVLFIRANHRLVMDDQPDENTKEFSMEELNVWNVEKLRKYLKYRGIAIANDTHISRIARLVIGKFTMLLGYICHCVALKNNTMPKLQHEERKNSLLMEFCFLSRRQWRNWKIGLREAIIFPT